MIDWAIGLLQEYGAMGNAGQVAFVVTILAPLIGVFGITRAYARRGYETSDTLTEQVRVAQNDARNTQEALDTLKTKHATLQAAHDDLLERLPESFVARLEEQLAADNTDPATRDVYETLKEFGPALAAGYAHLAREETKNVATTEDPREQAMFWRLARDNARVALALVPEHAEMASLEEELSAASDLAEQGLKVIPTDDAIRELRWKSRADVERSVPALMTIWERSFNAGNYLTSLSAAKEARRLAARGGNEMSPSALQASYFIAYSENRLGRHSVALTSVRDIILAMKQSMGADNRETLSARSLEVEILRDMCDYAPARTLALSILDAQTSQQDIGFDHSETLKTRMIIANIEQSMGHLKAALDRLEPVLEAQKSRADIGPEHPDTLVTQNTMSTLYDQIGDHSKALKIAQNIVLSRSNNREFGNDHPYSVTDRHHVAKAHASLGQYDQALAEINAVIDARQAHRDFGRNHSFTLASRELRAHILGRLEEFPAALAEAMAVKKVREDRSYIGTDNPEMLTIRRIILDIRSRMGDNDDDVLKDAIDVLETSKRSEHITPNHIHLAKSAILVANIQYRMGDQGAAYETLETFKTQFDTSDLHPDHFVFRELAELEAKLAAADAPTPHSPVPPASPPSTS